MSNKITRYGHKSDSQIIDSLRAENAALRAEVERLRMALADTEALELGTAERCKRWRESYKMQEQQLAASQLEAKWLREALDNHSGNYKPSKAERAVINQLIEQPTSTDALDAYVAEKVKELQNELERERMRLAACGTAALGYFEGCCDEYKSASLDDTLRLYAEVESLTRQRDLAVSAMEAALKENRIVPMFKALAAIKESEV